MSVACPTFVEETVSKRSPTYCMWSLGLDAVGIEQLRAAMGRLHHLVVLSEESLPTQDDADRDEPALIWIGHRFWSRMSENNTPFHFMEHLSRVLVLPSAATQEDFIRALQGGFQDVLLEPLSRERIHNVIARSLEVCNIHEDLERMTRELLLNRDLLFRKEEIFSFLTQFIARISVCSGMEEILAESRAVLTMILPVAGMHLAVWKQGVDKNAVHLYLDVPEAADSARTHAASWSDLLLSSAGALSPEMSSNWQIITHYNREFEPLKNQENMPDSRRTLLLPLCLNGQSCGVLALFLDKEYILGRDQVMALDVAMTHLALTLQSNARAPLAASVVAVGEVLQMTAMHQ